MSAAVWIAKPGLAAAPRGQDRQQPGLREEPFGLGQFRLPPDEIGQLDREVVGDGVERGERGEVVGESGDDELVHVLGPGQVLEAVLAHVADRDPVGQPILHQLPRRTRQHGLPAVGDRPQPGRPVDRRPVVVAQLAGRRCPCAGPP